MTDEVLAHTSDEHPWFRTALADPEKRDWYVWAAPRDDGTAPNNWLSAFAGPAWSYHPAWRACYHHKFLRQQPKLNWRNPDAKAAALDVLDRWLARGVDGFRLDVANGFLHDPLLTDNPPVPMAERTDAHWAHAPNLQLHLHDSNLPENLEILDDIRRTVERHADRFVLGEFSEEPERCGAFAAPGEGLHSGYSFPLLLAHDLGPQFIRTHYAMLARHPAHWPSVAFSNHDMVRTLTRFGGPDAPQELARLMLALLLSLRGTVLLYQGEELGLPEADLRREQLKDPVGDLYYPLNRGRDGCRTPMPWDADAPGLGFSTGTPWLPMAPAHQALAVSAQEPDASSTLHFARRFLAARRHSAALRRGEIRFREAPPPLLVFEREADGETMLAVFHLGSGSVDFAAGVPATARPLAIGNGEAQLEGSTLRLGPYASWFARL
jgi:alpha-glucosidase